MTYTHKTKGLSRVGFTAAALAATTLALPLSASAGNTGYYAQDGYHSAHEQCKADEKRDKIVGGVLGAVVGGVVGSNVAGRNVQDEGTAIGAVIGGLAGAGIADKRVDCDPVYNNTYGNGSYDNGRYYQGSQQPVVYGTQTYRQPQPVYRDSGYRTTTSYPVRTTTYRQPQPVYTQPRVIVRPQPVYNQGYYQQKPQHVRRDRRRARKAARKAQRRIVNGSHYHGSYVCHGHH